MDILNIRNRWYWIPWSNERKYISIKYRFSHQVEIEAEEGVKVETPNPNTIVVSGIDKERVGQMAALIRSKKKPEPYKGKGIKYSDERIIRKEGKTAGKK